MSYSPYLVLKPLVDKISNQRSTTCKNDIFKLRLNAQLRSNVGDKRLKHLSIFKTVYSVKKYGNLDMVILYAFVTPYSQNSPWEPTLFLTRFLSATTTRH